MVFDDMVDQPKYKNQGESAFFADGRQMRFRRRGRSPGAVMAEPDPSLLVNDAANYELKAIPLPLDVNLPCRGQKVFNTYCSVCHGGFGNGAGVTTNYGYAAGKPSHGSAPPVARWLHL